MGFERARSAEGLLGSSLLPRARSCVPLPFEAARAPLFPVPTRLFFYLSIFGIGTSDTVFFMRIIT